MQPPTTTAAGPSVDAGSGPAVDPLAETARDALRHHDVSATAGLTLLNLSENATYLVEDPDHPVVSRSVLRLHRPGYHSRQAIESELAWIAALRNGSVVSTPAVVPAVGGSPIVLARAAGHQPRFAVRFSWAAGQEPGGARLPDDFHTLGGIAARLHRHARGWARPGWFTRQRWDTDGMLGSRGLWGRWQDGPGVGPTERLVLDRLEELLRVRLGAHGTGADRFGLVHADMRLANLLADSTDGVRTLQVIDFDDCGFGWFGYDFAAAVSFIEDDPRLPDLAAAWLAGYRQVAPLPAEIEIELPTFVLARRLLLLAWLGSHPEVPLAGALGPTFASVSCHLAERFLSRPPR